MSGLIGKPKQPAAAQPNKANGLDVQTSSYGKVVPLIYGRAKLAGNLIDYFGFRAIPHQQEAAGSGKGGGGGSETTTYTYSVSFALALAEGPINRIGRIWQTSGKTDTATTGGAVFLGTNAQATWSKFPAGHDLNYANTAYVGFGDFDLGNSASLPNLNFEVFGLLPFGGGINDAEPSAVIDDICNSATHGLGFNYLADLALYRSYCTAYGIFLSPEISTETSAADALDGLLKLTNTAAIWSDGKLKLIPYGDQANAANGATYTPPTEARYDLTDADFGDDDEPVHLDRVPLDDLPNSVKLEIIDAAHEYVTSVVEAKDQADIDARGVRNAETVTAHAVKDPAIGRAIAQRLLQRALYVRNTYTFSLPYNYGLLEPMDVVTLTHAPLDLDHEPVRIVSIEESDDGMRLDVTAEEFAAGVAEGALYAIEPHAGTAIDTNAPPDATQVPIFVRAPQYLVDSPEIFIGVAGAGPNWGGAHVYISYDNETYEFLTTVYPGCRYGTLSAALPKTADPDTVDTLTVGLYAGELAGGTRAQADRFATLALVDHELIAYATAALNAGGEYDLTYLRRGGYGTAVAAHDVGAPFLRLDENIVRVPFDPGQVGQQIYIKFAAFNLYGAAAENLADVEPYTYTIGQGEEVPDVPPVPTAFDVVPVADGVDIRWENPNPNAVLRTWLEYSTDDANWQTLRNAGTAEHYTHHFDDGAHYYYRAYAESASHQYSDYTPVKDSTGKTVMDGADVTAEEALPRDFPVGGVLFGDITINSDGAANPGEVWYGAAALVFLHPNGQRFNIPADTETATHWEAGFASAEKGWLAFLGSDASRFANPYSTQFLLVRKVGNQWYYDDNTTWQPFTPNENDCVIAAVEHDAGDDAGISRIQRFAMRHLAYPDGTPIDDLKPGEKGADKTSDNDAGGVVAPDLPVSLTLPTDARAWGKGVHVFHVSDPTMIGLPASAGAGTLAIGIGGFDYPPGVFLTFSAGTGITWVRAEVSKNVWGDWSRQYNSGAAKPDAAAGDVENAVSREGGGEFTGDLDADVTAQNFARGQQFPDVTDTNEPPSWYRANYANKVVTEFKTRAAVSAPGSETDVVVQTKVPGADTSGGPVVRVVNTDYGLFVQTGKADDSAWNPWSNTSDTTLSIDGLTNLAVTDTQGLGSTANWQNVDAPTPLKVIGESEKIQLALPEAEAPDQIYVRQPGGEPYLEAQYKNAFASGLIELIKADIPIPHEGTVGLGDTIVIPNPGRSVSVDAFARCTFNANQSGDYAVYFRVAISFDGGATWSDPGLSSAEVRPGDAVSINMPATAVSHMAGTPTGDIHIKCEVQCNISAGNLVARAEIGGEKLSSLSFRMQPYIEYPWSILTAPLAVTVPSTAAGYASKDIAFGSTATASAQVTARATGGSGGYGYSWSKTTGPNGEASDSSSIVDGAASQTCTVSASHTTADPAAVYHTYMHVVVTDSSQQSLTSATTDVELQYARTANPVTATGVDGECGCATIYEQQSCTAQGALKMGASGGDGNYSYSWSSPASNQGTIVSGATTNKATIARTGVSVATVTESYNCNVTDGVGRYDTGSATMTFKYTSLKGYPQ